MTEVVAGAPAEDQADGGNDDVVADAVDPLDDITQRFGLRGCCRTELARARDGYVEWVEGGEEALAASDATSLAAALDHGVVAEAFERLISGAEVAFEPALGRFGDAVGAAITPQGSVGAAFLSGRGLDCGGDGESAAARFEEALAIDGEHRSTLVAVSELAEDRGDAAHATDLLRRAGVGDGDGRLVDLAPLLARKTHTGRNEPCPCGSGRKFKACCAARSAVGTPLERAAWLLSRAGRFAARHQPRARLDAGLRGAYEAMGVADQVSLVGFHVDLALFDEGGLEAYVDTRGPLLSPEDLDLARSWVGAPMRLYEADDDGMLVAGDGSGSVPPTEVFAGSPPPGTQIVARVLPVGDRWLASGTPVPVPESMVDAARELVASWPGRAGFEAFVSAARAGDRAEEREGHADDV